MVEHQGIAPCIPAWKAGVYLSTLMLAVTCSSRGDEALIQIERRGLRMSLVTSAATMETESRAGIAPAFAALQAAA